MYDERISRGVWLVCAVASRAVKADGCWNWNSGCGEQGANERSAHEEALHVDVVDEEGRTEGYVLEHPV